MNLFVVNVGVNAADAAVRGLRSPIFPDGTFEFIPILERRDFHGRPGILTYDDLLSETERASSLGAFVPDRVRHYSVHADPDFVDFTYGDIMSPRAANLAGAAVGDQLWFLARLWAHDGNRFEGKGELYFIGVIQVEANILVPAGGRASDLAPELRDRIWRNAHYRRLTAGETSAFRVITGSKHSSRRFCYAVQVTPAVAGHVYGGELGADGFYRREGTVLVSQNGQPRRFERFGSITRSVQPFLNSEHSADQPYLRELSRLAAAACRGPG